MTPMGDDPTMTPRANNYPSPRAMPQQPPNNDQATGDCQSKCLPYKLLLLLIAIHTPNLLAPTLRNFTQCV